MWHPEGRKKEVYRALTRTVQQTTPDSSGATPLVQPEKYPFTLHVKKSFENVMVLTCGETDFISCLKISLQKVMHQIMRCRDLGFSTMQPKLAKLLTSTERPRLRQKYWILNSLPISEASVWKWKDVADSKHCPDSLEGILRHQKLSSPTHWEAFIL